jgi:LPS-assembly lipoprotein
MRNKLFLLALFASFLAGCGFHLRGAVDLPFESVYVNGGGYPVVKATLENALRTGSGVKVVSDPDKAQVVVNILGATTEKRILSLGGTGKVREYQLLYRLSFSTAYNGKTTIAPQQIELQRDMTYDDTQILAKQQEEALLYQNMQDDATFQLLRRLKGATQAPKEAD